MAGALPNLLSALQLAASAGQIAQAKGQHEDALRKQGQLHHEQMEKSLQLHQEAIDNATIYHQEAVNLDRELHQHTVDLEKHGWDRQHVQWGKDRFLARKQAEREEMRDDWDQKNRRLDTAFLSATLIFAMIVAIICEGMPPMRGDDDGDTQTWSDSARDIGLDGWLFELWAGCLAMALACVTLAMIFIWRAMIRMAKFLSELNKLEHQWWKVKYNGTTSEREDPAMYSPQDDEDDVVLRQRHAPQRKNSGRTRQLTRHAGDAEFLDHLRERWVTQFQEADADGNELLEKDELRNLLDEDGFEFHEHTLQAMFDHFKTARDGKEGLTMESWLRCRRRIMIKSTDTSYPERMRMYWKQKVRSVYSASVYTVAMSLFFTLVCLGITVYSRLALLADNERAGLVFVVTVFAVIVASLAGFETWMVSVPQHHVYRENKWSEVGGEPDKALLSDPQLPADSQRRWDEYEFTRQFIRGKLLNDTEMVVKELEKAIDLERASTERDAAFYVDPSVTDVTDPVRVMSVGRPDSGGVLGIDTPIKRRFSQVLVTPAVELVRGEVGDPSTTGSVDALIVRAPADLDLAGDGDAALWRLTERDPTLQGKLLYKMHKIAVGSVIQPGHVIAVEPDPQSRLSVRWVVFAVTTAQSQRTTDEIKLTHALRAALDEVNKMSRAINHGRGNVTVAVAVDIVARRDLRALPDAAEIVYKECREYRGRLRRIVLAPSHAAVHTSFAVAERRYKVDQEAWRMHFKGARQRERARMRMRLRNRPATAPPTDGSPSAAGAVPPDGPRFPTGAAEWGAELRDDDDDDDSGGAGAGCSGEDDSSGDDADAVSGEGSFHSAESSEHSDEGDVGGAGVAGVRPAVSESTV